MLRRVALVSHGHGDMIVVENILHLSGLDIVVGNTGFARDGHEDGRHETKDGQYKLRISHSFSFSFGNSRYLFKDYTGHHFAPALPLSGSLSPLVVFASVVSLPPLTPLV